MRVALVTGGSRGIGRETAIRLAADGYAIAVVYLSSTGDADKVVAGITGKNGQAMAIQADVADHGTVEAAFILARELSGRDITVNAIAPGPTATDMFLGSRDEQAIAQAAASCPFGRLGTPADIAEVVAFLAGPGRWVNGQVIYANGGVA